VLRTSAELQFHDTPIARRCIGQRPPNRRVSAANDALGQATRMTIGRHCMAAHRAIDRVGHVGFTSDLSLRKYNGRNFEFVQGDTGAERQSASMV